MSREYAVKSNNLPLSIRGNMQKKPIIAKTTKSKRTSSFQIINDFKNEDGQPCNAVGIWSAGNKNVPVYHIDSFHLLTQFVGYAKYKNREIGGVYLRGQTSLYEDEKHKGKIILSPSCFRNTYASADLRISRVTNKLHSVLLTHKTLQEYPDDIAFPLLQLICTGYFGQFRLEFQNTL